MSYFKTNTHTDTYHNFLRHILTFGNRAPNRTGVDTLATFGYQMRFDLDAFKLPLITTKKIHAKSIIHELLWFLKGDTNIKYLNENGVKIWDEWADEDGNLGPVYGRQWRSFDGVDVQGNRKNIDQLMDVVATIKKNPGSRRLIVSAWNPAQVDDMALPPCHCLFQFHVWNGYLSCQLYQRSADSFLGVPFNIASYAMLTMMVAKVCDLKPREFIWTGGDCHIYLNHTEQVNEQLSREPKASPYLSIPKKDSLLDYTYEDFVIEGYNPDPAIKAPVAV